MSEPFSLHVNKAGPLMHAALRSAVHQVAGGEKKKTHTSHESIKIFDHKHKSTSLPEKHSASFKMDRRQMVFLFSAADQQFSHKG